ncbi:MAG TPA: protein-glutamate O-methyltransferase CheR, partial [Allocoleopsis sp.]
MEKILNLIREKIGLDVNSIGVYSLENTIKRRMEYYNFNHPDSYLIHLQKSPEELKELIELIVVPETWFFRDKESFVFLNKYLTTEWLPKNSGQILRVLSMPCATGEEPFSIAITLLESGLNNQKFSIDAIDISYQSLHKARTGIYEKNSFRGDDISYRDRYFLPNNNRYQLYDYIKNAVSFSYGNILDDLFMLNKQPYDIIFCRNLLIYLHNNARQKALQSLTKL